MTKVALLNLMPQHMLNSMMGSITKRSVQAVCQGLQKIGMRPTRALLHLWFEVTEHENDRKAVWKLSQCLAELDAGRFLRATTYRGTKHYDLVAA